MPLTAAVVLNTHAMTAGQNPPPYASLLVANAGATALVVTNVQMRFRTLNDAAINHATGYVPQAPIAPGQTVVVPAGGSITMGPMAITPGSPAGGQNYQTVNASTNAGAPANPQGAMPLQFILIVDALVYASDGTIATAAPDGVTVTYTNQPALGSSGGFLQFAQPTNFLTGLLFGVL